MWITPAALAADAPTTTNVITDTQNLLGKNESAVSDAIKSTEQETGVHVRLLYVETFGTKDKAAYASAALEDTDPEPNTVLLAVASGDGSLVVCVSKNSDEWLNNQKTIDALSDAAMQPLTKQGAQDWPGAATAMMDEIKQQKKTSTNSGAMRIGVIVMGVVLVVLVGVIVVTVIVRRRREVDKDAATTDAHETGDDGDGATVAGEDATVIGEDATVIGDGATVIGDGATVASAAPAAEPERPMTRRELREARKRKRGPFGR
ncbi:TPM domain-containing protein [Bifidobacterium parmae]|nr:TPM domain-containing protein [Bifidobacterium parmae]